MHLLLVQLDSAVLDVAGALGEDFSLVGQERERDVVDGDTKCVSRDVVENGDLPLGLTVL